MNKDTKESWETKVKDILLRWNKAPTSYEDPLEEILSLLSQAKEEGRREGYEAGYEDGIYRKEKRVRNFTDKDKTHE